ncbi:hypothetical protein [Prescottella subtropica]|uniref:hypothetical protein n=1 Tax=Prescottella subtropica TaxID=2545757 RepID=UPI0010F861F4|nr:hypothetical protein [Prescottella subtropica]
MVRTTVRAVFVDTSVFCNLLAVPGLDQDRAMVTAEYREFVEASVPMLLPVTTVVETGNHVAHCTGDRRSVATRFVETLRKVAQGSAPWIPHEIDWNAGLISELVDGGSEPLRDGLVRGVGTGDCLILTERAIYCRRMGWPVDDVGIWTRDKHLNAYN